MPEWILPVASAFWLGILTSISPCPLATNIAAISYVGRKVEKPGNVFFSGLLYTLGRMLAYLVIGSLLVSSMLSAPSLSHLLQKYMNLFLGPLLIITGMVLLQLINFDFIKGGGLKEKFQKKADSMGIWGAGLLGIVFALSFCPTSAALFFGSLLPLALSEQSGLLLPGIYGIGTGLPVIIFSIVIAVGTNKLAQMFNLVTKIEKWARMATGTVFILVGLYYCLTNVFGVSLSLF